MKNHGGRTIDWWKLFLNIIRLRKYTDCALYGDEAMHA